MERIEFLKARIALYRRYLREGAEGDMARVYLWLIWRDEIELTAIAASRKTGPQAKVGPIPQPLRSQVAGKPKDC